VHYLLFLHTRNWDRVLSKTLFKRSSKGETIDAETIRQIKPFEVKLIEGSLSPADFSVFRFPFSDLDRIFSEVSSSALSD
jgi:hypothetical protein